MLLWMPATPPTHDTNPAPPPPTPVKKHPTSSRVEGARREVDAARRRLRFEDQRLTSPASPETGGAENGGDKRGGDPLTSPIAKMKVTDP